MTDKYIRLKLLKYDECLEVRLNLFRCFEEYPIKRYFGGCSEFQTELRDCLKHVVVNKQKENYEDSIKRTAEIHERIRQLERERAKAEQEAAGDDE